MQEYEQSVFISYAWGGESEEIVNQIDQALRQRGLKIIRDKRDLGYKGSISAFMERIGQGNCVIVVISDKYLRSPNCMFELVEITEGKQFHNRVFPIVLSDVNIYDPVRRLEYVKYWELKRGQLAQAMKEVDPANLQGIREDMDLYDRIRDKVSGLTSILKDMNTLTPDMHKDSDFSEIYAGIERRMEGSSGLVKSEAGDSPYMGLRYFDTSDADLFYGRTILSGELLARIQKESFLAIVGASGSGKSSVARAGLIPVWKKENPKQGTIHIIIPTEHPLESLAASLTRQSESVTATSTLIDDMIKDARSLRLYVRKMLSKSGNISLLLVVDQFEEIFTLCKDPTERKVFIENLLSLAEENRTSRVVLALRADFYHHCAEYEGLRLVLEKHQAYIGAMTLDELREAITAPAENNGWDFQPGLVDLILQDVGTEPGALPLLSHALLETWKRRQARTLTLKGYAEAGGVRKAITQTAESVYHRLSPTEQEIARSIFLRLTELGEGVQDTRRRVKMDELAQDKEKQGTVEKVLKTLTDARLVTTERDSAEVAHEALIREWGTLRRWLDEDRGSLRLHRQLSETVREWESAGRNESFLLHRGGRLDDVIDLEKNMGHLFSYSEKEYLQSCILLREKEIQENENRLYEQKQNKILQAALFVLEAIGSALETDIIVDNALETLYSNFGVDNLFLLLFDKKKKTLSIVGDTLKYHVSDEIYYLNKRLLALDDISPAGEVARTSLVTKKQEYILWLKEKDNPVYFSLNPGMYSELCFSLYNKSDGLVGVIAFQRANNSFDNNDVTLIEIISRQFGLALERAMIYEDLNFKSAVAAQTSWAADLAHELNNEVGKLVNWAYLIRMSSTENEEIKEYAKKIEESAFNLSNTNPLAARSIKTFDIDTQLRSVLEKYHREIGIEYQLRAPGVKVKASPSQFQFVVKQLLNNARRAMSDIKDKRISIATTVLNQETVEILFQDFGPGFSEEKRSLVFQKQFTTKGSGGYGLMLVRQIIEDMEGTIALLPHETGKGAVFLIQLPIVRST